MPIQVSCPDCQRQLRVPDHLIGTQVRCPSCQTIFKASPEELTQGAAEERVRPPAEVDSPKALERSDRDPMPHSRPGRLPPRPLLEDDEDDDDRDYRPRRPRLAAHRGAMILTFGIVGLISIVLCNPAAFMSPAAWIMGQNDLREMRAGRMDPAGEGMTKAGWVLGIIGTIFFVLTIAGCMLWFAVIGLD